MSYYQDALAEWGAHADAALAAEQALVGEWTARAITAEAALADLGYECEAETATLITERDAALADLRKCQARVKRLLARIAELEGDPVPTMLVGSSLWRELGETHQDAFDRRTRNWGAEPEVIRYFFTDLPTTWPAFGNAKTIVSFKGNPVRVAAGDHDTRLRAFAATVPADGQWAYYHEREDNIERGDFTEAQWRAAFTRLQTIIGGDPGTILMGWTANPQSGRNTEKYTHGLGVDWIGWDTYPGPDATDTRDKYELTVAATKAAGATRWSLCETGLHEPNTRSPETVAAWIPVACDIARELGYESWCYFDSTVGGDFRLSDPIEWAAIGAEISR